jgi:single-stranded-DNA-specific exonuclease
MEPFGPENLRPVFIAKKVMDTGWTKIVKEQHIRFSLKQDNITFTGIGFGMAEKFHLLQQKKPLDIVFKIDENEWQGQRSLQLRMIDFNLSQL